MVLENLKTEGKILDFSPSGETSNNEQELYFIDVLESKEEALEKVLKGAGFDIVGTDYHQEYNTILAFEPVENYQFIFEPRGE